MVSHAPDLDYGVRIIRTTFGCGRSHRVSWPPMSAGSPHPSFIRVVDT